MAGGGVSRLGILPARGPIAPGPPGADSLARLARPGGGGATPASGLLWSPPQTDAADPGWNPALSRNRVLAHLRTALLVLSVPKLVAGRARSPQRARFAHEGPRDAPHQHHSGVKSQAKCHFVPVAASRMASNRSAARCCISAETWE